MERNSLLTSCSTIARKKRGLDTRYARACVQGVIQLGIVLESCQMGTKGYGK